MQTADAALCEATAPRLLDFTLAAWDIERMSLPMAVEVAQCVGRCRSCGMWTDDQGRR